MPSSWLPPDLGAQQPHPPPFKPLHDLTNKAALDGVWFAHDEGALGVGGILECAWVCLGKGDVKCMTPSLLN